VKLSKFLKVWHSFTSFTFIFVILKLKKQFRILCETVWLETLAVDGGVEEGGSSCLPQQLAGHLDLTLINCSLTCRTTPAQAHINMHG
jgi:hypothetical protein